MDWTAVDADDHADAICALTDYLTDVPAAFDVGVVGGLLITVVGWYDQGRDMAVWYRRVEHCEN